MFLSVGNRADARLQAGFRGIGTALLYHEVTKLTKARENPATQTALLIFCWDRVFLASLLILFCRPAPLIGDSDQIEPVKHQLTKISTALELQQNSMSAALRAQVAQSIVRTSGKYSLDPMLVLAVIQVESRFDHKAVSPAGAQGLMQVQPIAVTALAQEGKIAPLKKPESIKDPPVNVELGVSYLAYLKDLFGDWMVALTAYNIGPSSVARKIAAKEKLSFDYASKVLAARRELNERLAALPKTQAVYDEDQPAG